MSVPTSTNVDEIWKAPHVRLDTIEIRPYDPRWAESFDQQSARLQLTLAEQLTAPIEHIGSTSVPGLPAKPIIDMVGLVANYESFVTALPHLSSIGWAHGPEPGDREQRKWSICFPSVQHRTHHLHVVEDVSTGWPDWLLFRDYLRTHPEAAERYGDEKRRLAEIDSTDRVRYRASKAPLIDELMQDARTWQALLS
jgi:GrpB-like predicted nucleotidyltransferase (UPF0157 family)